MNKNRLFRTILIVIGIVILLSRSAGIDKHPKGVVVGIMAMNGPMWSSLEWVITSGNYLKQMIAGQFDLQTQIIIGRVGSYVAISDSSYKSQKRLIDHCKGSLLSLRHSVLIRVGRIEETAYQSKAALGSVFDGFLTQQSAGLLFGMVFGGSQTLSSELNHYLKITGMLHVVSASGYNVGLIRGIAESIWRRFWRPTMASFLTVGAIFSYVYLADATPSVVRAGSMISLQIVGRRVCHRQIQVLWLLLLTALLMTLINPSYLESLSFQFSVLACLGIILWGQVFKQAQMYLISSGEIPRVPLIKFLKEALWITLAAQSFTWGVQIAAFGEVSLIILVANPAAIWLTPWLTIGSLAFMCLGVALKEIVVIREFGLPILVLPLRLGGELFIWIISYLGQWEWGVVRFPVLPRWFPVVWCLIIACLAWRTKKYQARSEAKLYVS
jgi:competence protein ComEC